MYLNDAKLLLKKLGYVSEIEIIPCTQEEIIRLEKKLDLKLPESFKEFLLWCGHGLGIIFDNDITFYNWMIGDSEQNIDINESAKEIFIDDEIIPPHNMIVITLNNCGEFNFICDNEGENPPVYKYIEGFKQANKVFESFTNFLINEIFMYKDFPKNFMVNKLEKFYDPLVPINPIEYLKINFDKLK